MNPIDLASDTARRGAEALAGLGALFRSGAIRPMPASAAAGVLRQLVREGPKAHLIYAINAARDPDHPALVFEDRSITWEELLDRIRRLSNHLLDRGIRPGDALAVMLPNRPEFLETQAAALRIGATTAYVNPRAPEPEVRGLLERTRAKLLVTHRPEAAGEVDVLPVGEDYERTLRSARPDEPAVPRDTESKVVIFTSGTTGRPKGAVRNMGGAPITALTGLLRMIPFHREDVHMVVAPLYHSSGSGFAAMAEALANTIVLVEHFSPQAFCEHVQRHRVTSTAVVPTMLHKLCRWEGARDYDLSSLRIVVCTGAALREDVRAQARELLGDVLYDLYGSTEMAWVSVAGPADQRRKPGSVGRPAPGVEVRILDADGNPRPQGELGEIWARSPILMERYLDDPDLTAERMRDGFVSVRDLGYLDGDGYLYVVDRADDMVISGGVNVYPAEVEVALSEHNAVSEAAAFGIPDPEWGQRLVAAVVRSGETSPEELIAWCKERVSYAAVPKEIRFVDELPRNDVGKVDKKGLASGWQD